MSGDDEVSANFQPAFCSGALSPLCGLWESKRKELVQNEPTPKLEREERRPNEHSNCIFTYANLT